MLARELAIPLEKIQLDEFEAPSSSSAAQTYRVHALRCCRKRTARARVHPSPPSSAPTTASCPNTKKSRSTPAGAHGVRWTHSGSAPHVALVSAIATDIEEFWDHYQSQTLPKIFRTIMAGVHGELRPEFAPPFDTLKIDFHLSEPNYELGIDKERISSLEALQKTRIIPPKIS